VRVELPPDLWRMDTTTKRGFLSAKSWIQAVLLVTLFGFFVLGFLAYKTYTGQPPIPEKWSIPTVRFSLRCFGVPNRTTPEAHCFRPWRTLSSRYRTPAHACNACSMKQICTASDTGREIEHNPDSWLESELSRFHRGISLSLLLLAELLLVAEMIRHQRITELLFLGLLLVPITLLETQLASAFFASRAELRDSTPIPRNSGDA
jgi:hypothetical protein